MLTPVRLVAAFAAAVLVGVLLAPGATPGQAGKPTFKPEELEQVVAPIALYPDPVVAQIFMASTYPIEVVQAARLVQAKPDLEGEQLDAELKKQTWDDSVKSLTRLPQVLTMMNEKLDWTQKLGDAFLGQQRDVMDAVQRLRARAQASGNLQSTSQQTVTVEAAEAPAASPAATAAAPPAPAGSPPPPPPAASQPPPAEQTVIKIEPTDPQVVYVPSYSPTVVYGAWPYPAYPPYYYYPPGYVAGAALSFTAGVVVGGALWGGCNWNRGEVDIDIDRQTNFSANVNVEQTRTNVQQARAEGQQARAEGQQARAEGQQARAEGQQARAEAQQQRRSEAQSGQGNRTSWQHDPEHRKGVQYRDQATQQRYDRTGVPDAAGREAYRGRAEQARPDVSRGSAAGQTPSRSQGSAAFEGLGQGRSAQESSQRGASSVSSARSGGYAASGGGARAAGGARAGGGARGGGGRR